MNEELDNLIVEAFKNTKYKLVSSSLIPRQYSSNDTIVYSAEIKVYD